jgi:hypothetical protein
MRGARQWFNQLLAIVFTGALSFIVCYFNKGNKLNGARFEFEGTRIPDWWAKHYISDCGIEARLD